MSLGVTALGQNGAAAGKDMVQCTTLVGVADGTYVCGFVTPHFSHVRRHAAVDGSIEHKLDYVGPGSVD